MSAGRIQKTLQTQSLKKLLVCFLRPFYTIRLSYTIRILARDVTRTLIGGCIFIYSCSARRISFQIDQFEFDVKRNSSGRT